MRGRKHLFTASDQLYTNCLWDSGEGLETPSVSASPLDPSEPDDASYNIRLLDGALRQPRCRLKCDWTIPAPLRRRRAVRPFALSPSLPFWRQQLPASASLPLHVATTRWVSAENATVLFTFTYMEFISPACHVFISAFFFILKRRVTLLL